MLEKKRYLVFLLTLFLSCSTFFYNNTPNKDMLLEPVVRHDLNFSSDHANVEWIRIYDDPEPYNWDQAYDVALDSFGNVYCVGESMDMLLVKYNSHGDYILNRSWHPDDGYASANAVALDSSNNIYIAGQVNLRGDMFLLKYNYDCEFQWSRIWGGSEEDPLCDMAIDSLDNIYLAGGTESYSVGECNGCLIKYDSSGNQLWNRTWGGWDYDRFDNIAIDDQDNIYLGGRTVSYGDDYTDVCLVKYNSTGDLQWDMVWERAGEYYEYCSDIVLDSSNNIYVSVFILETFIPILAKFNNSGYELWNRTYPGLGFISFGMELDMFDNIYIATTFEYRDFGFAKINKFGDFQWSETWGTEEDEWCTSMALNGTDSIYLGGYRSFHSYGPMILVKFKFNPPDPPYFIDLQEDFSMYEGDVSKSLIWTPIDESMFYDSFWIMKNETKVIEGKWNGSQVTYSNLNGLLPGNYNFTCFVNNTYGGYNSSSIIVSILPNLYSPEIYQITSDLFLDYGVIDFKLSWYANDLDGNSHFYAIKRNSLQIASDTWINDSDINYTETEVLDPGIYNYTCIVKDTSGLINQSSIFVQITNHNPIISNITSDFIINEGTFDFSLLWHAYDFDGNTQIYWIERNGVPIVQDSWINDSDIIYIESEILDAGYYNYTCFVNDNLGAINQSSIFVKINSYPHFFSILRPSLNTYEKNSLYIFNCSVYDNDGTIEHVFFEFDGYNYTVTDKYLNEYSFSLQDLSANEDGYNFRWHAKDSDDAWSSTGWQEFIIHKKEVQLSILFNGTDQTYFYNSNPIINTTIINLDSSPGIIRLFLDGKIIQEGTGDALVNLTSFLDGNYNITAILIHENLTATVTSLLNIREIDLPEIVFEFNQFYLSLTEPEYYHNEIIISCIVDDFSPISWVYYCENSSGLFVNRSMSNMGDNNWTYTIDISNLNWNDVIVFSFYANDTRGNIGINNNSSQNYIIRIHDSQEPVTSLSFVPYQGSNGVLKSTYFTLESSDNSGSGVNLIRYKINDSAWINYNSPFDLSNYEYKYYNISFFAIDFAGNVEITKFFIVELIDSAQEPPPDQIIPGFDIFIILSIISISAIYLFTKKIRYVPLNSA